MYPVPSSCNCDNDDDEDGGCCEKIQSGEEATRKRSAEHMQLSVPAALNLQRCRWVRSRYEDQLLGFAVWKAWKQRRTWPRLQRVGCRKKNLSTTRDPACWILLKKRGTPVVLYIRSSVHEISSDYCKKMKFFCI
jgi:hypothetical protein